MRLWRRSAPVAAFGFAVFALAACGSSSSSAKSAATKSVPVANEVTLKLVAIHPAKLTDAVGSTVTWKQMDPGVHTVTSGTVSQDPAGVTPKPDGLFDSGELQTGKTFTHTFSKPGIYTYFCRIHPATMRGVITVQ